MHLVQVTPDLAEPIWPKVEGQIKHACEFSLGMRTPEETFARIQAGMCQLWAVVNDAREIPAVATTSVNDLPGQRILFNELLGGISREETRAWFQRKEFIEQWAREKGCKTSVFMVPRNWARHLRDYHQTHVVMVKSL